MEPPVNSPGKAYFQGLRHNFRPGMLAQLLAGKI